MSKLLTRRITSPAQDERLGWVVAFLFLVVCTALTLKMFPTLPLLNGSAVVLCVSIGWLVIGWEARSLWRRPTTEVTTARREPREEARVAERAAARPEPAPTAPAAPRVWTVFAVYACAFVGMVLAQALVALVFVVGHLAGGADIGQLTADLPALLLTPEAIIAMSLAGQFAVGLAALIPARWSREPTRARLGLVRPALPAWGYPLVAVGALFPMAVGLGLAYAVSLVIPQDTSGERIYDQMSWALAVPFLVAVALPAGLMEELLFRGYMQRRLLQRWSPWVAITVTTALFAVVHVNPHVVVIALPLGLWFGVLAWRTGSVWPGVVCHAFVDGVALVWQMGPKLAGWPDVLPTGVAVGAVGVAFGCFVASVWILKRQRTGASALDVEARPDRDGT
jgi:membrane protease YdiL (CAAX protease family)